MNFTPRLRFTALLIAGGLFIASLVLYIVTLAPSVVTIFDDSLEFQLVTYQLGIAHPTGYPLYTMLGKLFTYLPIGNVAYRVNLMSAVFGAATIALTYLLIIQMTSPNEGARIAVWTSLTTDQPPNWPTHVGGVIGALLLAVGPVFWQQATIAEVYTLNALFVTLLLLLSTLLPLLPESTGVYGLALLAGLSLTHHRTMVLLFPALAVHLLLTQGTSQLFRPKTLLLGTLFFFLPLLLYLYLPLRGHIGSLDGSYQNTWAGFWQQVTASGYGVFVFDNPFGQERSVEFYINLLADQMYTTMLGFIGMAYLLIIGQRKMLLLTGVTFITYLAFNIFYNVADIEVFFIPNVLIWAIWSGVGAAFLLYAAAGIKLAKRREIMSETAFDAVEREAIPLTNDSEDLSITAEEQLPQPEQVDLNSPVSPPKPRNKQVPLILTVGMLAVFGLMIGQLSWTSLTAIREQYTWQVHDYGLDMLRQRQSDESTAIVGILGEMTLLRYFQQTTQLRPDIETVTADLETDRLAAVKRLLAAERAVYLTRELPNAPERWSLSAVGPLIRVNSEPQTRTPSFSNSVNQAVTPEITLLGYDVSRPSHTGLGPAPVRVTLFWQVNDLITTDLKVSARLLDAAGEAVAVVDAVPVHFAYPTTAWRSGEIISDVYDFVLSEKAQPGQYTPLIILYDPAQNAAEVGRVELGMISLK